MYSSLFQLSPNIFMVSEFEYCKFFSLIHLQVFLTFNLKFSIAPMSCYKKGFPKINLYLNTCVN